MDVSNLIQRAQEIRNEKTPGANTAERVGGLLEDTVDLIDLHDKDIDSHGFLLRKMTEVKDLTLTEKKITPTENTFYIFGQLDKLELQNIPIDILPIIIHFSTGSVKTTLVIPIGTETTDLTIDINKSYELSIINGKISLVEFSKI